MSVSLVYFLQDYSDCQQSVQYSSVYCVQYITIRVMRTRDMDTEDVTDRKDGTHLLLTNDDPPLILMTSFFADLSQCQLTQLPDAVFLLMKNVSLSSCNLSGNLIQKIPAKLAINFCLIKGE